MTLTLTVPLPPAGCSPNWRGHWAAKAKDVSLYRADGLVAGKQALNSAEGKLWDPNKLTTISAVFFAHRSQFPDGAARPTDDDNCWSCIKPVRDGLRDAGLFKDDSKQYVAMGTMTIYRDKKTVEKMGGGRPRVEITLEQER